MVDDRLVVIDHGRACDAFKGNRFDRGDGTLCLKARLKTGKKHGGKGRSSKRMKAKCEGKRNPLRIDGSQFSPTDVKKKGIGPQIRIEPFAEPAEVLQDAIEGMTSWNSPTLPEAGKLARFQRRKPQKLFQRPLLIIYRIVSPHLYASRLLVSIGPRDAPAANLPMSETISPA